ncbi:MAG TPA: cysteine desulfurase family protein [Dehalococcoidia bacterium]|nr:cysteine desulfurase family protein [Dehalococcoidia bacterium]
MDKRIYLDHAATTPLDPRVLEAMLPYLRDFWGNPSSLYAEAQEARKGLEGARRAMAQILGCKPQEIIFTSGGSESDNLALRGVAYAGRSRGHHIITSAIEHHAVLHAAERLEQEGFCVTYLPVDRYGFIDLAELERAVGPETILVSIMYVNNEMGTIEPIQEAVRIVKAKNPHTAFHTDAVQAIGTLDCAVAGLGVDLLSLGAHKFYGPKGVGTLYVRSRTPFQPQQLGGAQEKRRRAGTENVPYIMGMAKAIELAYAEFDARNARYRSLRDRLLAEVPRRVPNAHLTGPLDLRRRVSNNFSCCFESVEGEAVLLALDLAGVAASSGSACTSGSLEPSHVLTAMVLPEDLARGSLRLTMGKDNTREEVDHLLDILLGIVSRLRALSPTSPERAAAPSPLE